MPKTNQALSGEVLDAMPPASTSMVSPNPYLGMIATMVERGGDLANLDKMLDLQLKWEANEARKAYVAAMAAFKTEPMEILKRKLVSFETRDGDTTSYSHAELSDVTDVVVPAMGKHGLSHRWDIRQEGAQITVSCSITHALGHTESVPMTAGGDSSGKKNAIQQVASTITYLQRYTLLAATGMATKGIDDDGASFEENGDENELDTHWISVAESLEHPQEYTDQREKMLKEYGGVNNMPLHVRTAFNLAKARVTPKDEA